jgi:hypothetical protein
MGSRRYESWPHRTLQLDECRQFLVPKALPLRVVTRCRWTSDGSPSDAVYGRRRESDGGEYHGRAIWVKPLSFSTKGAGNWLI